MVELEKVRRDAPWAWLKGGFEDLKAGAPISLAYGSAFTLTGLAITIGLFVMGWGAAIPVLVAGFALIAPAFAVGIYRINQIREAGETPKLLDFWTIDPGRITQLALLSVLMLVFFLTWARLAQFLFAWLAQGQNLTLGGFVPFLFENPAGVALLAIGTLIGAVLAFAAFTMAALSFPMLADQDVDAVTAVVASVKAVKDQPFVMINWAWMIAFMIAAGGVLFLVGIAVTFPWVAHATWRAYKDFNPRPRPSAAEMEARQQG
jgi:uncharacterized membrane protein